VTHALDVASGMTVFFAKLSVANGDVGGSMPLPAEIWDLGILSDREN
jgi:hypothetical protein